MKIIKQHWISLLILTLLVQPMLVFAQTADKANWSSVTSLPAGTSINIRTRAAKSSTAQ